VDSATSSIIITNTGVPQVCVLSPFLFTLYTNDCTSPSSVTTYIKYSDDTVVLGLLNNKPSVSSFQDSISHLTQLCSDNYLQLNVAKTKEMLINTPNGNSTAQNVTLNYTCINNVAVERVECFRYLGLTLDSELKFDHHTMDTFKRCQQRLSIIRKLKSLSVAPHLLMLLYKSIIQPVLLYCSICYFDILTVTNKNKLTRITKNASKIIGLPTPNLSDLNRKAMLRKAQKIVHDISHPLNRFFTLLPSGRRYGSLAWKRA